MRRLSMLIALVLAAACEGPRPVGPDAAVPRLELGAPCTDASECASGVCVGTTGARGVCSVECSSRRDCPAGENWACLPPAERPELHVCGCVPDGDVEICGDSRDNDCNGRADDCLRCGDRLVAGDDDEHCGACFVACADDERCRGGVCRCADRAETACNGRCVSLASDSSHCGACGHACAPDELCVAGSCTCPSHRPDRCSIGCTDLASDPSHCGSCENACPSGLECIEGRCGCPSERADRCGGECVDTRTDGRHCGGCGNACPAGLVCRAGACECTTSTVSDFCEGIGCVDLDTDPSSCGACGNACSAGLVCRTGVCSCPTTAAPDYCAGVGCVALQNDSRHCGTCGNSCPAWLGCRGGVCTCPTATDLLCDSECVSPTSDVRHCGACGRACRPGERCDRGVCLCPSGLICGGACVAESTSNCGGCGITCGPGQYCASGRCACSSFGYTACSDGCHLVSSDPANCGACGNVCPSTQICSSGTCRCPTGQTWCADLGRCVDLQNDASSCGTCGRVCPGDQICRFGSCRCSSSTARYCESVGACVEVGANDQHCGACDNQCPSGTSCGSSRCNCPVAGQTYCSSVSACVDTRTDSAHCGRCDSVCPSGSSCSGSRCVCEVAGQTACSSGCADLTSDESNCGTCGTVCSVGQECRSGACACIAPAPAAERRLTNAIGSSDDVRLAAGPSHVGAIYVDRRAGPPNVYFQRLDPMGVPVGTELELTTFESASTGYASTAGIAWTGSEWGVVWFERVGTSRRLVLRRIAADGTLQGDPVSMPAVNGGGVEVEHAKIWLVHSASGGYALLAQLGTTSTDSFVFRILGDGTAPTLPVSIADTASQARVAVGASGDYGAIYLRSGTLNFRRIEPDGSIIQPPVLLADAYSGDRIRASTPTIAHDGTEYVFAWVQYYYTGAYQFAVTVARGTASTARTYAVTSSGSSTSPLPYRYPQLSIREGTALLTWQTLVATGSPYRLDSRRFAVGLAGAPRALEPASTLLPLAVVADQPHSDTWTGSTTAVLAWADSRWTATEIYDLGVTLPACGP